MNQNLKSAVIGGGSIGSILAIAFYFVYVLFFMACGAGGLGGGFWVAFAMLMVMSIFGTVSWVWALIDASANKSLADNDRIVWIVMMALLGLWVVPFYWFKYVK